MPRITPHGPARKSLLVSEKNVNNKITSADFCASKQWNCQGAVDIEPEVADPVRLPWTCQAWLYKSVAGGGAEVKKQWWCFWEHLFESELVFSQTSLQFYQLAKLKANTSPVNFKDQFQFKNEKKYLFSGVNIIHKTWNHEEMYHYDHLKSLPHFQLSSIFNIFYILYTFAYCFAHLIIMSC